MTQSRTTPQQAIVIIAGLVSFGLMVSGCTGPRGIFPNNLEDDMRERHLVKEVTKTQRLTVMPIGSKHNTISLNDAERIKAFIGGYKESGLDHLTVHYAGSQAAQPAMSVLLKELNPAHIVTTIGSAKLGMAEIQLSYSASEAVLDQDCQGHHTEGGMTTMVPNKTMGCAVTLSFARQINDPRDLSEPRGVEKKFAKTDSISNASKAGSDSQGSDGQGKASQLISSILK